MFESGLSLKHFINTATGLSKIYRIVLCLNPITVPLRLKKQIINWSLTSVDFLD